MEHFIQQILKGALFIAIAILVGLVPPTILFERYQGDLFFHAMLHFWVVNLQNVRMRFERMLNYAFIS